MTEAERRANQSLHALDEAHRLGRITREEYRARRRAVLAALCDSHGVTARNAIVPPRAAMPGRMGAEPPGEALAALFPGRAKPAWRPLLVLAACAAAGALALFWLLRSG
ncbi:hypothetical protein ASG87_06650 [Frateuria sp. Soil773]|uniref:hypothetical protein n=1 Tax=Frateuria sp. Soil773 TaxID=1736407 RepID=UPI0006FE8F10|nr:hypothetical protein [Frateuria sp. Soil773]KRE88290.1 hypothetical protein ASG87_06650 [Frateuria sp. Soil773]